MWYLLLINPNSLKNLYKNINQNLTINSRLTNPNTVPNTLKEPTNLNIKPGASTAKSLYLFKLTVRNKSLFKPNVIK